MSMIPDEKVREVRERAPILEVISDYMSLRKSGANYQGLCPFHGEKTPSFNVNPARGIFHCFGCGAGGNAFDFIMRMEGLAFPQAVKFLAKRVGVEIPERPLTREEQRKVDEREELYRINELACEYYCRVLESDEAGSAGRSYLQTRGVDRDTAAAYRMGFAPAGWDNLAKYLQRKGVSAEQAEKLGLLRKRDSGGGYYDTFRNRLLFTISDLHGRAIGFGGRVMDDSLPKYINSPESLIYRKSEVLFGIDLAKKGMREKGSAIIVEGYFDHLALYRAGFTNVLATCGTALTPQHLKVLRRYAEKAYMLFDGDEAGRKATVRSMELFLEEAFPARVIEIPAEDDPDTFVKREGAAGFEPLLEKAQPIF
ncbi:DNA primase, partial [Geomonas sp.]|uniref:DNA primase n=1 Tax=Geomonas sp. TaxID=2651584 RepID=UPI002B4A4EF6